MMTKIEYRYEYKALLECLTVPFDINLCELECDFVLYTGNNDLAKRKEFEQYISKSLEI